MRDQLKAHKAFHETRQSAIRSVDSLSPEAPSLDPRNYADLISFLSKRGLDEAQLKSGSMPEASLIESARIISKYFSGRDAIIALHVGNFVGVSISYLSNELKLLHLDSLVIGIDPNLTHRNIANPQNHVGALLSACGLQRNTMLIAGYSGQKSISNDGIVYSPEYDPAAMFKEECACEDSLRNLTQLAKAKFDIALIDGNHDGNYLSKEIDRVNQLLKDDALLILDDVEPSWAEIREVFNTIESHGMRREAADGRIGIAVKGFKSF
jgi:hypothetical protein